MNPFRIAVALAAGLASGPALAEDSFCAPMQAEYVALLRQAQPGNPAAIAQQLAAAKADEENGNCNRFLFFGPPKSPACPSIQAKIAQLEQQLGSRAGGSLFASSPDEQKMSLQAALQENGCSIPSLSTPGRTLCARTCDGYYFPIENRASSSRIKVDAAVCQTMYGKDGLATLFVQRSDDVADARSVDGKQRYGDQSYAFLYRDTFDAACHAELKSGMASLEARTRSAGEEMPVATAAPSAPTTEEASVAPVSRTMGAATASATPARAHAALQAISAVQAPEDRPVRFVGSAYYAKMFSYSGE